MASGEASNVHLSWVFRWDDSIGCRCLWWDCSAVFTDLPALDAHVEGHTKLFIIANKKPYTCPVVECEQKLEATETLRRHMRMHLFHAHRQHFGLYAIIRRADLSQLQSCGFLATPRIIYEGTVLRCEWSDCELLFDDIFEYTNHMHDHIDVLCCEDRNPNKEHCCGWSGCQMTFRNKANLRAHVKHHSGDKTTACPFCGAFFSNNSKLFDHMLRKSSSGNEPASLGGQCSSEVVCKLCLKKFDSQRLLREHCRRHVMNYNCKYCAVTVDSPSALRRHIVTVHVKRKDFKCDCCSRKFAQKADLDRHSAVHNGRLEFMCLRCGMQFRWRKQLTMHERKHDKDYTQYTHLCHLCDGKYANGYGLSRHLIKKHSCAVPDGFTRYHYKKCADGFARLQTKRCLSKALALKLGIAHEEPSGSSAS